MRSSHAVVLASPVRAAIGTFGGALRDVPATDLGAAAIKATVERAGLKPEDVATVVMGNVVQAGNKMNPARQAAVHAGLPVTVPALTVNSRNSDPRRGGFASNGNVAIRRQAANAFLKTACRSRSDVAYRWPAHESDGPCRNAVILSACRSVTRSAILKFESYQAA